MTKKHLNLIFGALMLALAGALLLETTRPRYAGIEALNNGFPPSFYPRILLTVWAGIAVLLLVKALSETGTAPQLRPGRLVAAVAATAAYVWLMGAAGFLVASYAFTFVFLLLQGYRNAKVIAGVTAIFPTAAWWVMTGPMRITLPVSPWFDAF